MSPATTIYAKFKNPSIFPLTSLSYNFEAFSSATDHQLLNPQTFYFKKCQNKPTRIAFLYFSYGGGDRFEVCWLQFQYRADGLVRMCKALTGASERQRQTGTQLVALTPLEVMDLIPVSISGVISRSDVGDSKLISSSGLTLTHRDSGVGAGKWKRSSKVLMATKVLQLSLVVRLLDSVRLSLLLFISHFNVSHYGVNRFLLN